LNRPLRVAMAAAHGGYSSESVPLGGAAAIFERLCQAWTGRSDVDLTLLAPGPGVPEGLRYLRVDVLPGRLPSSLSELAYARFCRRFENHLTAALIRERPDVALVHDISEGPTFQALRDHGVPCVPILHVDVVDYFCRMYLRQAVPPRRAEDFMKRLRPWPVVPDLVRLVFDKQAQAVACCPHLVVPSEGMATILHQTYPDLRTGQVAVIPWGSPVRQPPADEVAEARRALEAGLQLPPEAPVLVTLSRISPEKGQDLLLRALAVGQKAGQIPAGLTLLVCGQAAYMQGPSFLARLRRLAGALDKVRVLFPGHLAGAAKRAALERADLFVSASRHESYGLTTMEALAAGTPVLALDTPGARQALDPTCGRILPREKNPAEALWRALRPLLADRAGLSRMGEAARRRAACQPFSLAADRLLELLAGLRRQDS